MIVNLDQPFYCRHCQETALGSVIFETEGKAEMVDMGEKEFRPIKTYSYVIKCCSCSEISLLTDWEASSNTGKISEATILYPAEKELTMYVPSSLSKTYLEAKRVKKLAPIAFVLISRKCLEIICDDQKAKGKNLKEKIEDLSNRKIIPENLSKMAGAIRYLGNIGAHGIDSEITYDQKEILADFLAAIIEYVYIAPTQLDNLRKSLQKEKLNP